MLQGQSGSQQQQLHDVLAFHIIPRLGLRDAQALSQTCTSLRTLIQTGLPDSTLGSLARNTFPAGHPILAVHDSGLWTEIQKLAAMHASIRSGQIASSNTVSLFEGNQQPFDAPLTLDHAGGHALCQRSHQLQLYRLDFHDEQQATRLVWTRPAPENHGDEEGICKIFWSPDDRWAAIWYTIRDYEDNRSEFNAHGWFDVLHIVVMDTLETFEAVHTTQISSMLAPHMAPDSNLILIQWTDPNSAVDLYSISQRKVVATVNGPGAWRNRVHANADMRVAFAPDSLRFAFASPHRAHVYTVDGKLDFIMFPPGSGWNFNHGERPLLAWSPVGTSLACLSLAEPELVQLFSAAQGLLECTVPTGMGHFEQAAGLLWGPYGLLPVLRPASTSSSTKSRSRRGCLNGMVIGCRSSQDAQCKGPVKVKIGHCMPVLSPDGAFVAALDSDYSSVQVFDARSGACVLHHVVAIDLSRCPTVILAWRAPEVGLTVQVRIPWTPQVHAVKEWLVVLRF